MANDRVRRLTVVIGVGPAGLAAAAALRAHGVPSTGRASRRARRVRTPARARPADPPGSPHLCFIGYTNPVSGMFREIAIDARRIAAAISRSLKRRTS